jgi:YHS domain-containing protein
MKLTWKSMSVNLLLLAMIGCNGGDEPAEPSASSPKVAPASPTPVPRSETIKGESSPAPTKTEPKSDAPKKSDDGPKVEGPKAENTKSTGGADALTAKQLGAIKQLPEAEQALALKQRVCPVNGGPLGAMGKPYKVTYDGRSFYLCCDSCEDEVKADPKAIIAKLDKK